MIRVVICGPTEITGSIISSLKEDSYIVGYTDIEELREHITAFDGFPYIGIEELNHYSFDNVVILYKDNESIQLAMKEFSFCKSKLIVYNWFANGTYCDAVKKFALSNFNPETLILGMSHAQNDIQTHLLTNNTYKIALPSMDIFCHLKVFESLALNYPDRLSELRNIIIELPYYIFNYDLSKSRRSVKNRLFYFRQFSDYHNYGQNAEEESIIIQFEEYLKVFNIGAYNSYCCNAIQEDKKHMIKEFFKSIYHQVSVARENPVVWKKIRKETVSENTRLFQGLINTIRKFNPEIKIKVIVCPFNPIFRILNHKHIKIMRKMFDEIIENSEIECIDMFNWSNNPLYFVDHCHLTVNSSYKFTRGIKDLLQGIRT